MSAFLLQSCPEAGLHAKKDVPYPFAGLSATQHKEAARATISASTRNHISNITGINQTENLSQSLKVAQKQFLEGIAPQCLLQMLT